LYIFIPEEPSTATGGEDDSNEFSSGMAGWFAKRHLAQGYSKFLKFSMVLCLGTLK
jgi:hypothetical protein